MDFNLFFHILWILKRNTQLIPVVETVSKAFKDTNIILFITNTWRASTIHVEDEWIIPLGRQRSNRETGHVLMDNRKETNYQRWRWKMSVYDWMICQKNYCWSYFVKWTISIYSTQLWVLPANSIEYWAIHSLQMIWD